MKKPLLNFILLFIFIFSTHTYATKHIVTVADFQFTPSSLSVAVGDTIHWQWSNGSHTTTSTSVPAGAATWNSNMNQTTTSFEYKVTVPGNYSYKCTPHGGMGMLGSFSAIGVGINTNELITSIRLFPNPAKDNATLEVNATRSAQAEIKIIDILGKVVAVEKHEILPGKNKLTLPVSDLTAGLYFASLTNSTEKKVFKFQKE